MIIIILFWSDFHSFGVIFTHFEVIFTRLEWFFTLFTL